MDKAELAELSVAQLRDELLACDPTNTGWIVQINQVCGRCAQLPLITTRTLQHVAVLDQACMHALL